MEVALKAFEDSLQASVAQVVMCARQEYVRVLAAMERERVAGLAELGKERSALDAELRAMQKVQQAQESVVELNVGGQRYSTSLATLRRCPGTMLDAMFSGRYEVKRSEDGSLFIDRDGQWFGYVLEYLRDGVVKAEGRETLRHVKQEFDYFGIELHEETEFGFAAGGGYPALSSVERYDVGNGLPAVYTL
jgi:hypothetical protein